MLLRPKFAALAATLAILLLLAAPRPGLTLSIPSGAAAIEAPDPDAPLELLRKSPYLIYPGDPSRMTVLWQFAATDTARISWGTDTTCALGSAQTTEYGYDHQHRITLEGLTAGTRYYYRVNSTGMVRTGSFLSGATPDATRLKFLAYGDTRSYPLTHDRVAAGIVSTYTTDPEYQTFTLNVGDLVLNGDGESDWTTQFFSPSMTNVRRMMADLPFLSCMGNHEGEGLKFVKYFPYPFVGGRYWSFDYGPAHFVIVDQFTWYGTGTSQLNWITADLAASTKPWRFVVLHEPGWSAGGGHPNNTAVQTYLEPLFEQYGVSVVFGGHNHYYARAVVNGVQHITTGGGGAPPHTPVPGSPNVVVAIPAYHFCKLEIDAGTLRFRAVNTDGAVIDSFTLTDTIPPLAAITSPVGGEDWKAGSVHPITWTATDRFGIASVDLAYSTDGGLTYPYTIASGLPNTGNYAWTVPNTPTHNARVRVLAYDAAGNPGLACSPADFTISTWTITASAGPGGSIAPSGAVAVAETATQEFAITPNAGYEVANVVVDGVSMGPQAGFTFTNVVADHTIAATFALRIAFDFKPHHLDLRSRGRWVMGILAPPPPFLASQIDVASIRLNGAVGATTLGPCWVDPHGARLLVKFDRPGVIATLVPGDAVPVVVRGTIAGEAFVGRDTIHVGSPRLHAPCAGSLLAAGTTTDVTWDASEDQPTANVTLMSSFDNGATWAIEADGLANTGRYTWTVPRVTTQQALLEVIVVFAKDETGVIPETEVAVSDPFAIATALDAGTAAAVFALHASNPLRGECMVSYSLASAAPARLAVYDVTGRQVLAREVDAGGPGRHTVTLGSLPAGVYVVRLGQAGRALTTRIAVIR